MYNKHEHNLKVKMNQLKCMEFQGEGGLFCVFCFLFFKFVFCCWGFLGVEEGRPENEVDRVTLLMRALACPLVFVTAHLIAFGLDL